VRGDVVDTHGNTIRDALDLVPDVPAGLEIPEEPFGIASLHRFELLGSKVELTAVIEQLREASQRWPILFIDHPVTVAAVRSWGLEHLFDDRLVRVPRQRYFPFISLLKASSFLVTDSGGSQEECAHLGHPCLVHRAATERQDGLDGGPVVLSGMDQDVLRRFLDDPLAHRRVPVSDRISPTQLIVADLVARGHLAGTPAGDEDVDWLAAQPA
jgi:UDP-N-acetylglucosamine 2-epimerase (non-hydrolysing)